MKASKAGKTVGVFTKDNFPGEFCENWRAFLKDKHLTNVDISVPMGYIMCPKEDSELITIKKACLVTIDVFNKYLKEEGLPPIRLLVRDKVGGVSHRCVLSVQVLYWFWFSPLQNDKDKANYEKL